jgi:hypothetical protein
MFDHHRTLLRYVTREILKIFGFISIHHLLTRKTS